MRAHHTVVLSKLAQSGFDEIIHASRKLGLQIAKAIDRLAQHPQLGEALKGRWKGYWKYRTGDYRIVYRVEQTRLLLYVVTLDDRKKDVYR